MQNAKTVWTAVVIVLIIGAAAFGAAYRAKAPTIVDFEQMATSTFATSTGSIASTTPFASFPIDPADTLAAWRFQGAYSGNDTLIQQADADIAHLTSLLGSGKYDDYDLYNGIANDYGLLGDGRAAYQFYNRSIRIHPNKGLAYANLAHLMDQLGAKYTAADAYAAAVHAEPGMLEYHIERLTFLVREFRQDHARITAALSDASSVFGDTPPILTIEANWLAGQGKYQDAITLLERAKTLTVGQDTSALDAQIAAWKAKLQ